jgi:hypothetical protein
MEVTHPRTLDDDAGPPPATVDVRGERVAVKDGTFEVDDGAWVRRFASAYEVDPGRLVEGWDVTADEDEDTDASGESDTIDPEEFVDRTPVSDVAEGIREGEADDQLQAVKEAEEANRERKTVAEAIEERRDELEEE